MGKLSDRAIKALDTPGYYGDGDGLWLQVRKSQSEGKPGAVTRSWLFRFMLNLRSREMGLGPYPDITLAEARKKAADARRQVRDGVDPIEDRKAKRQAVALERARCLTFDECAEKYIKSHRNGWKNPKHAQQWENTLATYASPVFGKLPVAEVDTTLVMKAIEPIWAEKTETASRVRGRIESVLSWAAVRGYRKGENPARWRGHLDTLLPARSKVAKVKHHPALPYSEAGAFMKELRCRTGVAAQSLEFLILTAARTEEVRTATWDEIDLNAATWVVPGERMKAGKAHTVPLSDRAVEILKSLAHRTGYVFCSPKGEPLSNAGMDSVLKRMGRGGQITVHGFRSTFRDWAAETTAYPNEVVEMALAHTIGNKAEAAYRRGDLFMKRRRLMAEWAKYCERTYKGAVVPLNSPFLDGNGANTAKDHRASELAAGRSRTAPGAKQD
jgi:integrase